MLMTTLSASLLLCFFFVAKASTTQAKTQPPSSPHSAKAAHTALAAPDSGPHYSATHLTALAALVPVFPRILRPSLAGVRAPLSAAALAAAASAYGLFRALQAGSVAPVQGNGLLSTSHISESFDFEQKLHEEHLVLLEHLRQTGPEGEKKLIFLSEDERNELYPWLARLPQKETAAGDALLTQDAHTLLQQSLKHEAMAKINLRQESFHSLRQDHMQSATAQWHHHLDGDARKVQQRLQTLEDKKLFFAPMADARRYFLEHQTSMTALTLGELKVHHLEQMISFLTNISERTLLQAYALYQFTQLYQAHGLHSAIIGTKHRREAREHYRASAATERNYVDFLQHYYSDLIFVVRSRIHPRTGLQEPELQTPVFELAALWQNREDLIRPEDSEAHRALWQALASKHLAAMKQHIAQIESSALTSSKAAE